MNLLMERDMDEIANLERIAQLLESLPSDYLLEQAWTQEQRDEWHNQRTHNQIIAECWRAKLIRKEGDPIAQALEQKEIDKLKYEGIWRLIDFYDILWDVVQLVQPHVKFVHSSLRAILFFACWFSILLPQDFFKYFGIILKNEYRFNSVYDLFAAILKENEDARFSLCLEDYQTVSMSKGEKGFKQVRKLLERGMSNGLYHQLNPVETQNLKSNFASEKFSVSWLSLTIITCQLRAQNDPLMREKLKTFNDLTVEMCRLGARAYPKRESVTWRKPRSFTWKKGKKVYGVKNGGVYR